MDRPRGPFVGYRHPGSPTLPTSCRSHKADTSFRSATSTHEPHMPEFGTAGRLSPSWLAGTSDVLSVAFEKRTKFLLDELGHTRARIVRVDEPFEHLVEVVGNELVEHAVFGRSRMIFTRCCETRSSISARRVPRWCEGTRRVHARPSVCPSARRATSSRPRHTPRRCSERLGATRRSPFRALGSARLGLSRAGVRVRAAHRSARPRERPNLGCGPNSGRPLGHFRTDGSSPVSDHGAASRAQEEAPAEDAGHAEKPPPSLATCSAASTTSSLPSPP